MRFRFYCLVYGLSTINSSITENIQACLKYKVEFSHLTLVGHSELDHQDQRACWQSPFLSALISERIFRVAFLYFGCFYNLISELK